MELHPLLSRLEKTDLERYVNACKDDVINFLEDLGLSSTLALKVLEDVRASISWKTVLSWQTIHKNIEGVIMKDYEVKVLDENDHIFIDTLKNLGISRNVATMIAYLMNVDEASSQEIEISTGLRQPEVSLALKLMYKQSWISVRSEKKPGKGRPMKIYSLMAPIDEIISFYEDKIYRESQETILAIKKVKAMSKNMPLAIPN
jgi:predicted transcriptional regulator